MAKVAQPQPDHNCRRILEGERDFLRVILASATGTATLAEATPPEFRCKPFPDGGRWRGSIPKRLAGRGIIGAVPAPGGQFTSHRSPRKARRLGLATVWRLINAAAARLRLRDLDTLLEGPPRPRQKGLFDDLDDDAQHVAA